MNSNKTLAKIAARKYIGPHYNEATEFHEEKILVEIIEETYAEQEAKLAELEAIVKKLPKTGDGVPITLGLVVYDRFGMSYQADMGTPLPDTCKITWNLTYSTRDAARKANCGTAEKTKEIPYGENDQ